jgi:hypothetical protein
VEQTWLDEDTALKAAARKGWGFESLLLRHFQTKVTLARTVTVTNPSMSRSLFFVTWFQRLFSSVDWAKFLIDESKMI